MASSQDTEITLGTAKLLGLFFGLVKIVAERADHDDQCADNEEQDIAVAGHRVSMWREFHHAV